LRLRISLFVAAAMLASLAVLMAVPLGRAQAPNPSHGTMLAEIEDGFCLGATAGPDNAIYVGNAATASIVRVDATTGATSTVATGLPAGEEDGPTHIVFIGSTMYVLTTGEAAGVYRIDSGTPVLVADIAAFNLANPPETDPGDLIPTGNPFGIDVLNNGDFIVVDANFNRVLRVKLNGDIEVIASFGNIVPTRVQPLNGTAYVSQIGAFPHTPDSGRVSLLNLGSGALSTVASGVPYIIDVESGPGGNLFAISFGEQPEGEGGEDDPPAVPFTGQLLVVGGGAFAPIVTQLFLPTSLDFIGNSAFIVTINCQVWRVDNVSSLVTALTPTPTATATATPTSTTVPATATATTAPATATPGPPATGSGYDAGGSGNWWLVPATAALLLAAAGTFATLRRKPGTQR
jgi:hypothetical protein